MFGPKPGEDEPVVEKLRWRGFVGVVAAVYKLSELNMTEPAQLERAARINLFLQDSLGFNGIRIHTGAAAKVPRYSAENAEAGTAWLEFLGRFAWNEEAFQHYRRAMVPSGR